MSKEHRFFDAQTTTTRVTRDFIVILLGEGVDLDTELHVTNLLTQVGGTYRVAWTSPYFDAGSFRAGLELLDPEGEIWEEDSLRGGADDGSAAREVQLACARCGGRVSTAVPDAETEALVAGFTMARHCDTCKATTGWVFCAEGPAAEAPAGPATTSQASSIGHDNGGAVAAGKPAGPFKENREKGRAPIKLGIKITRNRFGYTNYDVCETINVSRTGAYFATRQAYDPGEIIDVILPYHPDSLQIPVKARVIRQDPGEAAYQKRVAIHLLAGTPMGR